MRRRQFLLASSGGLALACGGHSTVESGGATHGGAGATGEPEGGSAGDPATTGGSAGDPATTAGGSAGDPATTGGSAGAGGAPAPTCGTITAPNIEGPYFKVESPQRKDIREAGTSGTLLIIRGIVYGTDCKPISGALLDFWQADETGAYDTVTYVYRGHQFSGGEGGYELATIIPGPYLNGTTYRPAHVHVKAQAQGTLLLTTQLYFEGDPFNAGDPFIVPTLIMTPVDDGSGSLVATFDFVLPPA